MTSTLRGFWLALFLFLSLSTHAASITDTVIVGGKEWAQVDLFTDLSWANINEVCPGGVCGAATLNGYDMAGWSWASYQDLNSLFNLFLINAGVSGPDLLSGRDSYESSFESWSDTFFNSSGFRPTAFQLIPGLPFDWGERGISGSYSNAELVDPGNSFPLAYMVGSMGEEGFYLPEANFIAPVDQGVGTNYTSLYFSHDTSTGGWFYRDASVPLPSTLALALGGVIALVFRRRAGNTR